MRPTTLPSLDFSGRATETVTADGTDAGGFGCTLEGRGAGIAGVNGEGRSGGGSMTAESVLEGSGKRAGWPASTSPGSSVLSNRRGFRCVRSAMP